MNPANIPHGLKVDLFMPLEIGRYLQDTAHLSTCKSGAYLHLLMHYWTHGPLPNDMEQLANIARMTPDAWSIAYASLMHFFSIGPDGMLHQAGCDRRLVFWRDKRLKAKEKASKAARARWSKYKAKQGAKTDAPSIAYALHEQCPISEIQVQEQKQTPPPPPKIGGARVVPFDRAAGGSQEGLKAKSGNKAKTIYRPVEASKNGKGHNSPSSIQRNGHGTAQPRHLGQKLNGATADAHVEANHWQEGFKKEVLKFWRAQNPGGLEYVWTELDSRALSGCLGKCNGISLETFKGWLRNRAASGISPAALPYKWLRSLMEYASGPLDAHKKPAAGMRQL